MELRGFLALVAVVVVVVAAAADNGDNGGCFYENNGCYKASNWSFFTTDAFDPLLVELRVAANETRRVVEAAESVESALIPGDFTTWGTDANEFPSTMKNQLKSFVRKVEELEEMTQDLEDVFDCGKTRDEKFPEGDTVKYLIGGYRTRGVEWLYSYSLKYSGTMHYPTERISVVHRNNPELAALVAKVKSLAAAAQKLTGSLEGVCRRNTEMSWKDYWHLASEIESVDVYLIGVIVDMMVVRTTFDDLARNKVSSWYYTPGDLSRMVRRVRVSLRKDVRVLSPLVIEDRQSYYADVEAIAGITYDNKLLTYFNTPVKIKIKCQLNCMPL